MEEFFMSEKVNPVPEVFNTVNVYLVVKDVAKAIEFYKEAFGAELGLCLKMPGTEVHLHVELRIGDSTIMLSEENPEWGSLGPQTIGGSPVTVHLYVPDTDAVLARAEEAGATVEMPIHDSFWGDRYVKLKDPFGHSWSIASRQKEMTEDEIMAAMKVALEQHQQ